jgi:glycerol-3-phosphate dehydrogenase
VRSFDARQRASVIGEVSGGAFDLVVVGGGINGAGVAHDAALRGLKVLLLEQRDLAFGTSSRSSKLIHGGLRYLEHYQFRLVFEGTNERAALRHVAPHLVRPLMFALPVYEGARFPLWMMDVGLWMYDSLSLFKVEKRHITLRSPKRMLEREPLLNPDGLTGGIIYYDCMTDDARITLENAMAAAEHEAVVLTQARVVKLEQVDGGSELAEVTFRDLLRERDVTVRTKAIVNCTGVWTDSVRRLASIEGTVIRPTKGVHLVLRSERLPIHHASALVAPQDGRVFFAIPWMGRTVIGTTDTDFEGDPSQIAVVAEDVKYLLFAANHYFPKQKLVPEDVIATWAGLRPLIHVETEHASDVPREHKLFRDGRMVTVAGGKLTTYRRMAAETVDHTVRALDIDCPRSTTAKSILPGGRDLEPDFDAFAARLAKQADLPEDVAKRLANVYGSRGEVVAEIAAKDPSLKERVAPDRDVVMAEIVHAVEHELALTLDDVLVRRTSLALTAEDQALSSAEKVAEVMGKMLGWSPAERQRRVEDYERTIDLTRAYRREL